MMGESKQTINTSVDDKDAANLAAFSQPLHVGSPNVGNLEVFLDYARKIFERRWFTNNGLCVQELEEKVAAYLNVKHCILTCNATSALDVLGRTLELTGEVIVPSFTFVATPHSLLWQKLTPVFCDIDPNTHNIDPEEVKKLIGPETSAILAVHVWGRPAAVEQLSKIAEEFNLKLIFDAAHAFGCSYKQQMIGGFGNAEVFSFHATKCFNTFEGGAITTNDDLLACRLRRTINFGFAGVDKVLSIGTNAKMSEISAAMGLTSFQSFDAVLKHNYSNYLLYKNSLNKFNGYSVAEYKESEKNNYHYIIVEIDSDKAGYSRDELVDFLRQQGVLARKYFYPGCHEMEPYRSSDFPKGDLGNTNLLTQRVLSLPNGTAVSAEDVRKVIKLISEFHGEFQ